MTAPAAVVLAAGEGRRMGGPKALLLVDRQPLVRSHVVRLREAGCGLIVVVVRTECVDDVREALRLSPEVALVEADTSSMAASLALGLEHVPAEPDRTVVIATVDMLPVRTSTLHELMAAATTEGVQVATPRHRGRGGHPVVARETLLRAFRQGYTGTLRDLIRGAGAARRYVDVDDAAVGHDLDTPGDLSKIRPGSSPDFAASCASERAPVALPRVEE